MKNLAAGRSIISGMGKLVAGVLLGALLLQNVQSAVVTVSGYQIKLNGNPFVVKGMNYSPVPIGATPQQAPYGDYFVKKYDNVWKPDIDRIRAAGVNVIKLYAGDPALNAGAAGSSGNWKEFLDYCYNKNKKPIYVVMMSFMDGGVIAGGGAGLTGYVSDYKKLVASTANHPALFGYLIGNEIYTADRVNNAQFWTNLGTVVDAAHQAGQDVGRNVFLASASEDNYTAPATWPAIKLGEQSGKLGNLDSWMLNVYRGPQLGGTGDPIFTQYLALMQSLKKVKPLFVGEWGTPHTTRTASTYGQNVIAPLRNLDNVPTTQMGAGKTYFAAQPVASFLTSVSKVIEANFSAGSKQVCAGGFVFDWCDEYWKGGNASVQQGGPDPKFHKADFAGGYRDEAGFGLTSAVDKSLYGRAVPINRTVFKGYAAVKKIYSASSWTGAELYNP